MVTKEDLINFENEVVETFNDGKLKSPVHLSGSKDGKLEEDLIELFKQINKNDWVFTTYRSHYHSLLKGVDKEWLKQWILDNKSIHVMNKEHKIFTSAIVGGCLPIALGVALTIKLSSEVKKGVGTLSNSLPGVLRSDTERDPQSGRRGAVDADTQLPAEKVYVFCGDMTGHTGIFWECVKYASFHDLPIKFVIEDNGLSTDTLTNEAWGVNNDAYYHFMTSMFKNIIYYKYERKYPHYGTGVFVSKLWENTDETKQKGF